MSDKPPIKRDVIIKAAQKQFRRRQRPETISRSTYRNIEKAVLAICAHLPDPFPGQDTLAKEADLSRGTLQRALKIAEDHKIIERYWRAGGCHASHGYLLPWWSGYIAPRPAVDTQLPTLNTVIALPQSAATTSNSTSCQPLPQNAATTLPHFAALSSSPAEKKCKQVSSPPASLREAGDGDDGSSSSPEAGWESNRLEAALAALGGGGQDHDPDPETGWCEGCQRKHNRFPGLAEKGTGCVECGEDVPRLTGHLSGTSPIHIDCELSPAANQERAALEAQLREVKAVERKQVGDARIHYDVPSQNGGVYQRAKFPDDYVLPDWWIRQGCV